MSKELLPVGDKMFALFGVACQGGAGHGQFQPKLEFDRGIDHGIKSEDLLLAVGILGIAANPNSCVHIGGQPGATKEEGIGFCAVAQDNAGDESSFNDKIEPSPLKLLLEAEDLVEDAGLVGICFLKKKGQDFHPGSGDIWGKPVGRAVCPDADFFAHDNFARISKAVKDALFNVIDDTSELDVLTVFAEIGATFVPGIGWEKSAVGSQDFKGNKP